MPRKQTKPKLVGRSFDLHENKLRFTADGDLVRVFRSVTDPLLTRRQVSIIAGVAKAREALDVVVESAQSQLGSEIHGHSFIINHDGVRMGCTCATMEEVRSVLKHSPLRRK